MRISVGVLSSILLFLGLLIPVKLMAWNRSVLIGAGCSNEVGFSYENCISFLDVKWHRFQPLDPMLYYSVDTSLGVWRAQKKQHRYLANIALSIALRAYFVKPLTHHIRPYLLGTFGPTILSQHTLGIRTQGSLLALQTTLGAGIEWMNNKKGWDFNLRMIHICNAGIFSPNEGFEVMYLFSVGYLFS